MPDELGDAPEDPFEGIPEVGPPAPEIDITDAALAAAGDVARVGEEPDDEPAPEPEPEPAAWDAVAEPDRLAGPDAARALDGGPAATPGGAGEPGAGGAGRGEDETPPLRKILESILLVVDEPVPEVDLAQVLETPRATVLAALDDLAAEYLRDGRGFELRQVAGGWRLYTAPDCAPYVERFVLDGQQARLTQAALETLAVVAYRQPVTRQSVAAIRGVNVDGVIRTLLTRGLIAEAGEDGPGGAHLYVTTPYFLERLGLRSLDELPNLAPLLPANLDDLTDHA